MKWRQFTISTVYENFVKHNREYKNVACIFSVHVLSLTCDGQNAKYGMRKVFSGMDP